MAGDTPATYGGLGWKPRTDTLDRELSAGKLWHRCGCSSETGKLKEVLLSMPGEEINFPGPPDRYLMLERPDLEIIREQAASLAELYESLGVKVHLWEPRTPPPPNFLFMRDLFWSTPEGIVLARPAAEQRAGEERFAAEALASIGVPIILYPRGEGTFEGADALWLDSGTMMLGTGIRTNHEGMRQIGSVLKSMNIELLDVPLPEGVQHLLGIVNFVDKDLAVLHGGKATGRLKEILSERGIRTIELAPDREVTEGRGMNFVTVEAMRIVMPAGCPGLRKRYEENGIEVHEAEVFEYIKAAGGPGCLTGILMRE